MGTPYARAAGPQGRRLSAPGAIDVVRRIEASLAQGGFTVTRDSVAGRQAVIGRATRLGRRRVFVLVALFKAGMANREHLDRFLDEAGQYAATVKGGLGATATAVAVAVIEAGGPGGTEAWALAGMAAKPQPGRAPAFPVLVEVGPSGPGSEEQGAGRVVCAENPTDLRGLIREHVERSLRLG